jgi:hypothetical protein
MASQPPRHRSSLLEIWIGSADRLEQVSLTASGTRQKSELTEVFLTILFLLGWILQSFLFACIELVASFFPILWVFAWSRRVSHGLGPPSEILGKATPKRFCVHPARNTKRRSAKKPFKASLRDRASEGAANQTSIGEAA